MTTQCLAPLEMIFRESSIFPWDYEINFYSFKGVVETHFPRKTGGLAPTAESVLHLLPRTCRWTVAATTGASRQNETISPTYGFQSTRKKRGKGTCLEEVQLRVSLPAPVAKAEAKTCVAKWPVTQICPFQKKRPLPQHRVTCEPHPASKAVKSLSCTGFSFHH